MKKNILLSLFLAVALFVSMACQSVSTADSPVSDNKNKPANQANTAQKPADEAPRISLADAKKDFDAGNAVFVDTRAESAYKNEHIKGSLNLPMEAVEARYKEIPTDKKIIAYCS